MLSSIEGRRNRWGKDEFEGGGYVYPDVVTIEAYQSGNIWIVKVDKVIEKEVNASLLWRLAKNKVKIVYKPIGTKRYNYNDFKPIKISESEAEVILKEWGVWPLKKKESASGVTN